MPPCEPLLCHVPTSRRSASTLMTQSSSSKSLDRDGNQSIKVGVRVRPLAPKPTKARLHSRLHAFRSRKPDVADARAWSIVKSETETLTPDVIEQKASKKVEGRSVFRFDAIFDEPSSTAQVYESMVRPIVKGVVSGRNGTVFAYGQTSSGKTYTMQGNNATGEDVGLIQLATEELFQRIGQEANNRDYTVRASFIEIYNEKVHDLLGGAEEEDKSKRVRRAKSGAEIQLPSLEVRKDSKSGEVSVNCEEVVAEDSETVMKLLRVGNRNRACAATNMNEQSSRSHAIFRIVLESREKTKEGISSDSGILPIRVSTLNMVDLSGSENGHSAVSGHRRREGGKINQSLLSLSQVIHALSLPPSRRPSYINYRDSKLTRILQPCLAGNSLMAILCCITVSKSCLEETRSTLKFAARAQLVQTAPKIKEMMDDSAMIKKLQQELSEARLALKQLQAREHTPTLEMTSEEYDDCSLEVSNAQDDKILPLQFQASSRARGSNEKPPREVTILRARPASPVTPMETPTERESRLLSKLMEAQKRSEFLETKLDATEDLVDSLFKDVECSRKCIYQLISKMQQMQGRVGEEAQPAMPQPS